MTAIRPATLVLHTPSGPLPCCDVHAALVRGELVVKHGAADIFTTPAATQTECACCQEAAEKVA